MGSSIWLIRGLNTIQQRLEGEAAGNSGELSLGSNARAEPKTK
jgi:hypothetical protein